MDRRHALAAALIIAALPLARGWLRPADGPMPPRGATATEQPGPELSTLVVPVTYPYEVFARGLSERVPEVFIDETGKPIDGGMRLDLRAARDGDIGARADGDALVIEIPITVDARVVREAAIARRASRGKSAPEGAKVDAELVLEIRVELALDEAWHLVPEVQVSHRWRGRPTLAVGVLRIGLAKLADKLLADAWGDIGDQIATKMQAEDKFRTQLEKAWPELWQPKLLSEEPQTWLVSRPEALFASVPEPGEDALTLTVGMSGTFEVLVGNEPEAVEIPPLPSRLDPPEDQGFRLALSTNLGWESLSAQAAEKLVGASLSDQVDFRVDAVELYPSGDSVALALDVHAALPGYATGGSMGLVGRPELDRGARQVSVADFDYGLQTRDSVLASASSMARSTVETAVGELTFPYGEPLEQARAAVEAKLSEDPRLDGQLDVLDVRAIRVTNEGLVVDAVAEGLLTVRIDEPPPEEPIVMEPRDMSSMKPKLPGRKR